MLRAAAHHRPAMVQEDLKDLVEGEHPGPPVHQGQIDDPEGALELGSAVELPQHQIRVRVPVQLQHHPDALPVGLVPQVRDAVQMAALRALGDGLDEGGLVHHVGDLGDDDGLPAPSAVLDVRAAPDDDLPPSGLVGVHDAVPSQDDPAGGEVRTGQEGHQLPQFDLGILQEGAGRVDDLPQVVGGHVGGHPHGDARAAVDQQIGHPGGQDEGFLEGLVEVGPPVHRLLVDVRQHLLPQGMEAGLGVPHGRRGIPVDGAEVALSVHQRVAEAEVLAQPGHGLVDRRVSVGMVLAHGLPHHPGGLLEGLVVPQPQLQHGVEDPALHRFEAVPGVGQGPAHNDAHGVVEIAVLDLLLQGKGNHLVEKIGLAGILIHLRASRKRKSPHGRQGQIPTVRGEHVDCSTSLPASPGRPGEIHGGKGHQPSRWIEPSSHPLWGALASPG